MHLVTHKRSDTFCLDNSHEFQSQESLTVRLVYEL